MKNKKIKRWLPAIIYLIILLSIIKIAIAATFDFNPTPPITFNLSEDEFWSYDVNVTADEGLVNFSMEDTPYANLTIDPNTGLMTFTPTNDDVGLSDYYLIIVKNMSDPAVDFIATSTRFNITNVNDPPNITGWYPANLNFTTYENITGGVYFSINATDDDIQYGDYLNVSWFLDGDLKKNETNLTTQSSWTFYPGFADAGTRNVTVIVTDTQSAIDSLEWSVEVNDSNRIPVLNKTIENITWYEGNNNTDNFSLRDYFYDLDEIDGTNNLTFGYIVYSVYNAWNASMQITISINQTTGNVSFYTPHKDWFGEELVQFYANDSMDVTYSNNLTINITNINDPPVLDCPDNQTFAIEVLFTIDINASDIDSGTLYFSDNSTLFNISVSTGIISFIPNSTDQGTYDINISVNDSELSDSCIVVFDIIDNEKPVLANISNRTTWESSYFEIIVNASDADLGDNLTFSDDSPLFDIYTINSNATNATGLINFTPINADVGNHTIKITVTDSKGATDSKIFNLEINNINNPPYFTTIPSDVRVNFTYAIDLDDYTMDLDGDILNFTSNSSIFNTTISGIVNVTLNSSYIGIYHVNFTANDGIPGGTNYTVVNYTVSINRNPQIAAVFNQQGQEDITFNLNLGAIDPDGDTLTFIDNTTMFDIGSNGLINFVPEQQDVGFHAISINVTDYPYDGFNSTMLYLNISDKNDPPIFIQVENQTLEEEITYIIYIVAYDEDGPFSLNFGSNTTMFTIEQYNDTAGRINFTPDDADVGLHAIQFSVSDTIAPTVYQIVFYNITGINDAPTITGVNPPTNYTMLENSSQLFNITVYDPDTNLTNITYKWYKESSLVSTATTWTFTPGFCDAGNYNITVVVSDDYLETDTHIWNITINNSNRPPVFNATIPDVTWRQPYNRTDNFSLKVYTDDPDFECNGSQQDTLTYGVTGNTDINVDIEQTSGNVSFYINSTWFGIENVQFTATDGYNISYSNSIALNVTENFAPTINQVYPYGNETFDNNTNITTYETIFDWVNASWYPNGTKINVSENMTVVFNQQSSDQNTEDNSSLSYQWLLDGVEQITTSSWTYDIGFNESGTRNVTLRISDGFKTDSFYWNVSIENKNIGPIFGTVKHTYQSDFSSGTTNRTNLTLQPGNVTLTLQNSTDYYSNGSYLSPIIDFSDDNLKPELTYAKWAVSLPQGTNVTMQTRTSSDSTTWTNWSNAYSNSTQSPINLTYSRAAYQKFHEGTWDIWEHRYLQYRLDFSTTNTSVTPAVNEVIISYEISDFESDEDVTLSDWIDLDDYFYDPDGETLTLNYTGTGLENFDYVNIRPDHVVSFKPQNDWFGTATITFSATDTYGFTTYSNEVILTIVDIVDEQQSQSQTTVTRTVTRIRTVPEPELVFLELIIPGPMTVGPDETIIVPILLQNNGEIVLNGIRLYAATEEEGISLEFTEDYFPSLDIGQSIETELFISTEDGIKAGTYSIIVEGEVENPEAKDTAIITISVLENMTDKINAVRDFLQLYPECLELNELIVQARTSITQGRQDESIRLLDEAVDGCKYLISTKEDIITPSPQAFKLNMKWATITAGAWILMLLLIHLISVITRRKALRYREKKE